MQIPSSRHPGLSNQRHLPSNQLSSSSSSRLSIQQREDTQPNETSSWLPRRLRRPIEPPPIRSVASQTQTSHHPNDLSRSSVNFSNSSKPQPNVTTTRPIPTHPSNHYHHHSYSSYRPNHAYLPSRPSSYRCDEWNPDPHPRDSYRFRRHSAYEKSHLDLHSPLSSSTTHSNYRSQLDFDRHFHSTSSNFPPIGELPDSTSQRHFAPAPKDSETCHIYPSNHNASTTASQLPPPPEVPQSDSCGLTHFSSSRNTPPRHPSQYSEQQAIEPEKSTNPTPPSNKRMKRPYVKDSSEPGRVPATFQINPDFTDLSPPPLPRTFDLEPIEAPAFKKIKICSHSRHDHPSSHVPSDFGTTHGVQDPSVQQPPLASPQESHPALLQDTRIASPRESRNPSSPELQPQTACHPPQCRSLGFKPPMILVHSTVTPLSTREEVVKMTCDLLKHLGSISNVEIRYFVHNRKSITFKLAVTFQDSDAAIVTRRIRSLKVPPPFLYKENRLVISFRPPNADKEASFHPSLSSTCLRKRSSQSLIASPLPQESHSQDKRHGNLTFSETNPDDPATKTSLTKDTDMMSISDDNTRDKAAPLQSQQSSRFNMRSSSPEAVSSSSKKVNETLTKPYGLSKGCSVVPLKNNPDSCPSPNPPVPHTEEISLPQLDTSSAEPLSRSHRSILTRGHINPDTTPNAAVKMIHQIFGRFGSIELAQINEYVRAKKSIFLSCTVTFDQVHTAETILSQSRFIVPPPYSFKKKLLIASASQRNRSVVDSKRAEIDQVTTNSESGAPVYPNPPSCVKQLETSGFNSEISGQNQGPSSCRTSQKRRRQDDDKAQSICPVPTSKSTRKRSGQQHDSSSDEMPLWNVNPSPRVEHLERTGSPHTGSGCPNSAGEPHRRSAATALNSDHCDYPPGQSAFPLNKLRVRGHFRKQIKNQKIEDFVRRACKPFGKIIRLEIDRHKLTVSTLKVTFKDSVAAKQALKLLDGLVLPSGVACKIGRPHYLCVSFDQSPGTGCLTSSTLAKPKLVLPIHPSGDELPHERDARSKPSSSVRTNSRSGLHASYPAPSSRCSSPQLIDVREHSNNSHDVTHARNHAGPNPPPSTSTTDVQIDHDFKQPETAPDQLGLPIRVVKYPIPSTCQESHPSYMSNRLHFKLEKIRLLSSLEETVLDSSWDVQHLILHVVTKSEDSLRFQVQPPAEFNDMETTLLNTSTDSKPTPPDVEVDELSDSNRKCLVESSVIVLDNPSISTGSIKKHRTWPFDPLPTFIDDSIFPDFSKTLVDFLTTFFRLWEESRSDLRSLYDESAVFSNILAKQGRKPLAITKSTGWPSIFKSISRLPALSNDPISDFIVDACPCSLNPPRVVCSLHGSFSEFPKNVKRAFDRTLILRPVDTHLRPSEGCLGLLKWVTLSDTLTIRKHSTRTEAIVEGFMDKRSAAAHAPLGLDDDLSRKAFQDNLKTLQLSGPDTDIRADSTSSRALTRSTHSPVRVSSPLQKVDVSAYSLGDQVNQSMVSSGHDSREQSRVTSKSVDQSQDLAQMQSQLRAMQAEIQHLKSLSKNPTTFNSTNQDEQRMTPNHRKSRTSNLPLKGSHKVFMSTSCSHVGFGVSSKRLLLPTNLSRYLVISMRGDVLTWDHNYPDGSSQVQLILSGASPIDIVDTACYSNLSQTLIVGSRVSKAAKNVQNCNVRLVKLQKSSLNDSLTCQRIELEDPYHENGVRALALSPNIMNDTSSMTSFLTAGQEKFISLWKVTPSHSHNNSSKKIKHYQQDVVKIQTDHTSTIQALAVDHLRRWVLSGGQDGKVYATDLSHSNHQTLFSEEKNHILDIQMNPVVQDTVMITTGNKAPGSQFRYCDLRMAKPVISFGFAPNIHGNIESPIKYQRKGSLRDYLFSYPNGEKGGVLIWDLRYLTVPSSSLNTSNGIGIQSYFESMNSIVVLEKEHLTKSEIRF